MVIKEGGNTGDKVFNKKQLGINFYSHSSSKIYRYVKETFDRLWAKLKI